ncbi:hypothetical protein Bca52824_013044 [Brassica carinata]|uniref:Uncharacterized protein n=1 Tax=Brassica carinata TaxID=52824 RepID=A0A8X7VY76_BRACI|nr:hypothetical protein Bca52824_013044 [Brassica carinata]
MSRIPHGNNCGMNKCVNVIGSYRCEKTLSAILGGTLSSGLFLLAVGMWLLCKVHRKRKAVNQKKKFFKRNGGLLLQQQTHVLQCSVNRTKLFSSVRMLGAYFLEAMRNDRLHDILDARIKEECDHEEVFAVAKLARRCLSLNSEYRPTMRDVFIELDHMQSKGKSTQIQAQKGEEHDHIHISISESMSLSYTSPDIVVENSSFSLDSKPLMPHKTR